MTIFLVLYIYEKSKTLKSIPTCALEQSPILLGGEGSEAPLGDRVNSTFNLDVVEFKAGLDCIKNAMVNDPSSNFLYSVSRQGGLEGG